jgi:hypothetical protein
MFWDRQQNSTLIVKGQLLNSLPISAYPNILLATNPTHRGHTSLNCAVSAYLRYDLKGQKSAGPISFRSRVVLSDLKALELLRP